MAHEMDDGRMTQMQIELDAPARKKKDCKSLILKSLTL